MATNLERCLAYLDKIPRAVSGSGGHAATLRAACECMRFGLDDSETAEAMGWYNANRCDPPWSPGELAHKIESAKAKATTGERVKVPQARPAGRRTGQGGKRQAAAVSLDELRAMTDRAAAGVRVPGRASATTPARGDSQAAADGRGASSRPGSRPAPQDATTARTESPRGDDAGMLSNVIPTGAPCSLCGRPGCGSALCAELRAGRPVSLEELPEICAALGVRVVGTVGAVWDGRHWTGEPAFQLASGDAVL